MRLSFDNRLTNPLFTVKVESRKQKIILKNFLRASILLILTSFAAILWANFTINRATKHKIYNDPDSLPSNNSGLLLGTSKYLRNGRLNQYFENRIAAAVELYKKGKIKNIIISGDNSNTHYNEPEDMKNELVERGVPVNSIYLDFAGFRTFDSVYRLKEIFGQENVTIISQKFHNQRAVYIANALNINAIGFNAKDVDAYNGFKTKLREKFARVKVFIDLLTGKKPKFLGNKVEILTN